MSALESDLKWCSETQTLSGWASVNGIRTHVSVPREMIHRLPVYNDAVEWEIERYKSDIIQRLQPLLTGC